VPNRFSSGKFSIAQCDRCSFRFKLSKLKSLTIKTKNVNILVCPECWEADHPQLKLGMYPVNDPQAVRNPRPDSSYPQSRSYTEVIYIGPGLGLAAGTLATNGLPPTPPAASPTFFSGGFYAGGFYAGGHFSVTSGVTPPPVTATSYFSGGMFEGGMYAGGHFSVTSGGVTPPVTSNKFFSGGMFEGGMYAGGFFSN
jgi:hypothetical protein